MNPDAWDDRELLRCTCVFGQGTIGINGYPRARESEQWLVTGNREAILIRAGARIGGNGRAIYLLEKVLEGPASRPSPVLSRIQFGHCPQFHLQRGITIVYSPGARPRRRVQARSPASTINLISNALSASRFLPPPTSPPPPTAPPRPATPRRPLQPLDEQEFSILSSTAGRADCSGLSSRATQPNEISRRPEAFLCRDSAFG